MGTLRERDGNCLFLEQNLLLSVKLRKYFISASKQIQLCAGTITIKFQIYYQVTKDRKFLKFRKKVTGTPEPS